MSPTSHGGQTDGIRQQLLNTIAHELSTPLTPIQLQLHLLAQRDGLDEQTRRSIDIVARNVERMHGLVQDILDIARLDSNRLSVHIAPTDIAALVRETVEDYHAVAQRGGLSLRTETPQRLEARADATRIAQVLQNLVRNAVRFTPVGGTVTIRAAQTLDDIEVTVEDTGVGFSRGEARRLFQPFSQLAHGQEKAFLGAGLGLYICRSIIELHGGKIWADSPGRGHGASFGFRIPRTGSGDSVQARTEAFNERARRLL